MTDTTTPARNAAVSAGWCAAAHPRFVAYCDRKPEHHPLGHRNEAAGIYWQDETDDHPALSVVVPAPDPDYIPADQIAAKLHELGNDAHQAWTVLRKVSDQRWPYEVATVDACESDPIYHLLRSLLSHLDQVATHANGLARLILPVAE